MDPSWGFIEPCSIDEYFFDRERSCKLQDSILANMRFLRNQGFKDGLALGLARFGLVNNNNTANQANNMSVGDATTSVPQQQALPMPSTASGSSGVGQTNAVKQKSLLRKNRQAPTPFEMNVTGSAATDQSQNRVFDASKSFSSASSSDKPGFLEDFKLVRRDGNFDNAQQNHNFFQQRD